MRHLVLVGLVLTAATPSLAAPSGGDAIVRDGVEVTILPAVAASSGRDGFIEVALDIEAQTDAAARRLGLRSARAVVDVDCRLGANRFVNAEAYDQPNLTGAGRASPVEGNWVRPSADSYVAAVISRVCGRAPAAPAPPITATTSAAPVPPPSTAPPASAAPTPAGQRAQEALRASPRPPATRSVASPAPSRGAGPTAPAVAQVAASPTAKGAERELAAVHSLIAPPLAGTVEPTMVGSVQVFRASVTGFSSAADARGFCAKAAALVKACWVRPSAAPSAKGVSHRGPPN